MRPKPLLLILALRILHLYAGCSGRTGAAVDGANIAPMPLSIAASDEPFKVAISTPVCESCEMLRFMVANTLKYVRPSTAIVLHVNQARDVLNASDPNCAAFMGERQVLVNPCHRTGTCGTLAGTCCRTLGAHIINFRYIIDEPRLRSVTHVVMQASNEFYIRPGLEAFVSQHVVPPLIRGIDHPNYASADVRRGASRNRAIRAVWEAAGDGCRASWCASKPFLFSWSEGQFWPRDVIERFSWFLDRANLTNYLTQKANFGVILAHVWNSTWQRTDTIYEEVLLPTWFVADRFLQRDLPSAQNRMWRYNSSNDGVVCDRRFLNATRKFNADWRGQIDALRARCLDDPKVRISVKYWHGHSETEGFRKSAIAHLASLRNFSIR